MRDGMFGVNGFGLYRFPVHRHDKNEAVIVKPHRVKPSDNAARTACRHRQRGVARQKRYHLAGLLQHFVKCIDLLPHQRVELFRFACGHGITVHERIDIQSVAGSRRNASCRGVRLFQIPHFLQLRHFVADGSTRQGDLLILCQKLRSDRLTEADMHIDNRFQNLFFSITQFRAVIHPIDLLWSAVVFACSVVELALLMSDC